MDPQYPAGAIVWVKLEGGRWWPGEVAAEADCSDVLENLRKPPVAVVKFFEEDCFHIVKSDQAIYPYECAKKQEFLKRGKDFKMSGKDAFNLQLKFDSDVAKAEAICRPAKKFNVSKHVRMSSSPRSGNLSYIKAPSAERFDYNTVDEERRPFGLVWSRYEEPGTPRIRQQPATPKAKDSEYTCDTCGYKTARLENIVRHHKSHSDPYSFHPGKETEPMFVFEKAHPLKYRKKSHKTQLRHSTGSLHTHKVRSPQKKVDKGRIAFIPTPKKRKLPLDVSPQKDHASAKKKSKASQVLLSQVAVKKPFINPFEEEDEEIEATPPAPTTEAPAKDIPVVEETKEESLDLSTDVSHEDVNDNDKVAVEERKPMVTSTVAWEEFIKDSPTKVHDGNASRSVMPQLSESDSDCEPMPDVVGTLPTNGLMNPDPVHATMDIIPLPSVESMHVPVSFASLSTAENVSIGSSLVTKIPSESEHVTLNKPTMPVGKSEDSPVAKPATDDMLDLVAKLPFKSERSPVSDTVKPAIKTERAPISNISKPAIDSEHLPASNASKSVAETKHIIVSHDAKSTYESQHVSTSLIPQPVTEREHGLVRRITKPVAKSEGVSISQAVKSAAVADHVPKSQVSKPQVEDDSIPERHLAKPVTELERVSSSKDSKLITESERISRRSMTKPATVVERVSARQLDKAAADSQRNAVPSAESERIAVNRISKLPAESEHVSIDRFAKPAAELERVSASQVSLPTVEPVRATVTRVSLPTAESVRVPVSRISLPTAESMRIAVSRIIMSGADSERVPVPVSRISLPAAESVLISAGHTSMPSAEPPSVSVSNSSSPSTKAAQASVSQVSLPTVESSHVRANRVSLPSTDPLQLLENRVSLPTYEPAQAPVSRMPIPPFDPLNVPVSEIPLPPNDPLDVPVSEIPLPPTDPVPVSSIPLPTSDSVKTALPQEFAHSHKNSYSADVASSSHKEKRVAFSINVATPPIRLQQELPVTETSKLSFHRPSTANLDNREKKCVTSESQPTEPMECDEVTELPIAGAQISSLSSFQVGHLRTYGNVGARHQHITPSIEEIQISQPDDGMEVVALDHMTMHLDQQTVHETSHAQFDGHSAHLHLTMGDAHADDVIIETTDMVHGDIVVADGSLHAGDIMVGEEIEVQEIEIGEEVLQTEEIVLSDGVMHHVEIPLESDVHVSEATYVGNNHNLSVDDRLNMNSGLVLQCIGTPYSCMDTSDRGSTGSQLVSKDRGSNVLGSTKESNKADYGDTVSASEQLRLDECSIVNPAELSSSGSELIASGLQRKYDAVSSTAIDSRTSGTSSVRGSLLQQ